jgi:hypothetical protein
LALGAAKLAGALAAKAEAKQANLQGANTSEQACSAADCPKTSHSTDSENSARLDARRMGSQITGTLVAPVLASR